MLHSFSNRWSPYESGQIVCNLTLKWCKMSFYLILFQCEIWNMTLLDVNNKWDCTFHRGIFLFVKKSNSTTFWLNIMEIQEWTKNYLYKNVQTHIFEMWRHWMLFYVNKFPHSKVSNTMELYTVLMWGKRLFPTFIRTLSIGKWVHHKTEFDLRALFKIYRPDLATFSTFTWHTPRSAPMPIFHRT